MPEGLQKESERTNETGIAGVPDCGRVGISENGLLDKATCANCHLPNGLVGATTLELENHVNHRVLVRVSFDIYGP